MAVIDQIISDSQSIIAGFAWKWYLQGLDDAEKKIIHCKDCKYWGKNGYRNGCKYANCIMEEDDFCSCGERRTE